MENGLRREFQAPRAAHLPFALGKFLVWKLLLEKDLLRCKQDAYIRVCVTGVFIKHRHERSQMVINWGARYTVLSTPLNRPAWLLNLHRQATPSSCHLIHLTL